MKGIGLLLLYNLIFIIPFLLITLGVHFGFTTTATRAETMALGTPGHTPLHLGARHGRPSAS